jgi:drug/metabolite transporter (DMT)-like permease
MVAVTTTTIVGSSRSHSYRAGLAVLAGAVGMVAVGGSTAVSGVLLHTPLLTAQSIRYALASLLLVAVCRVSGRPIRRPRLGEAALLAGITVSGLVIFNIALVHGAAHAEPAVFGVAVASVPVLLAVIGPLLERGARPGSGDGPDGRVRPAVRRPAARVGAAALVVTLGAALVQGLGRSDGVGLALAVVVLACEAAFTLLAVPLLGSLGAWGVSVHTTWLAAVVFAVLGLVFEGPAAVTRLTSADWIAIGYLAVVVTAIAFVLWYSTVTTLGAARAGLLTGVAPIAAAATGVVLGGPAPRSAVWFGIVVVAAGLVLGLRAKPHGGLGVRLRERSPQIGAELG